MGFHILTEKKKQVSSLDTICVESILDYVSRSMFKR